MAGAADLGVGVIWFAGLDHLIEASEPLVDMHEAEPATVSLGPGVDAVTDPAGPLAHLRDRGRPVVTHGVSCPVGGTLPADPDEEAGLAAAADLVDAPWVSEHLSIDRVRTPDGTVVRTGFFLPPAQTPEAVEVAAARIRHLQRITGRPVAFETGVNYLRPRDGELRDGRFFAAIAEAADCLILCDLHNLWCNERNGRQPVSQVIDDLPVERVCEVHLAGGQERDGYLLDAHSNLVDPALEALAHDVIQRLPALRALTFELMPDYVAPNGIDAAAYRGQLERLQRLWDVRGRRAAASRSTHVGDGTLVGGDPAAWEGDLWAALSGRPSRFAGDPGVDLYRHLIATIRAGGVVTNLRLAYRLLVLTLGVDAADDVIERFRNDVAPSAWARDEARSFGAYLKDHVTGVPHLDAVVDFELAASDALATGEPTEVRFDCDPGPLLDALRRGVAPPRDLPSADVRVLVTA